MLINLDLAKKEGKGPSGARHWTGAMEFMAIKVLLRILHTYWHDIEAFFSFLSGYALAAVGHWLVLRKSRPQRPDFRSRFSKANELISSVTATGAYLQPNEEIDRSKDADLAVYPFGMTRKCYAETRRRTLWLFMLERLVRYSLGGRRYTYSTAIWFKASAK